MAGSPTNPTIMITVFNQRAGSPLNPPNIIIQSQGKITIKPNHNDYPITRQDHHQTQPK
jgi:hypothetical protein